MSLWQASMAIEGVTKANAADDGKLSDADADYLWELIQQPSS